MIQSLEIYRQLYKDGGIYMDYITEVTKRDIVDILHNGFLSIETIISRDYYENQYPEEHDVEYKINWYGRLEELEFLSRIYNLNTMKSYDSRFRNAREDIINR